MQPYYEAGGVTIYNADCREVLPSLQRSDLICTDPPYGLGSRLLGGTWGAKYGRGLEWDQEAPDLSEVLLHGAHAIVWGGNYFALPPSRCWLVWRKPDAVRTMADVDLAWTSYDAPSRFISHSIAATNKERNGHPTQKPLRVMMWSIAQALNEPVTVLDPFMGSGTTLVAAKELGKIACGIELDERYCEIAARRLSQEVLALDAA